MYHNIIIQTSIIADEFEFEYGRTIKTFPVLPKYLAT